MQICNSREILHSCSYLMRGSVRNTDQYIGPARERPVSITLLPSIKHHVIKKKLVEVWLHVFLASQGKCPPVRTELESGWTPFGVDAAGNQPLTSQFSSP